MKVGQGLVGVNPLLQACVDQLAAAMVGSGL
jgi:hypothetical protein